LQKPGIILNAAFGATNVPHVHIKAQIIIASCKLLNARGKDLGVKLEASGEEEKTASGSTLIRAHAA
jgi:3-deoxy-D-manno-octulosonate 8-phosphate phosphatase KdsC-like HAD superfamily phosphatase